MGGNPSAFGNIMLNTAAGTAMGLARPRINRTTIPVDGSCIHRRVGSIASERYRHVLDGGKGS